MPVEQDIPQRAAADRGDHRDDRHAQPVQVLPSGREDAAHGEDGDAQQVEDVPGHRGLAGFVAVVVALASGEASVRRGRRQAVRVT